MEKQKTEEGQFEVLAVPYNRAFVVASEKTKEFKNSKMNPEIRQHMRETAKTIRVNNLVSDGPSLKRVRRPNKK